MSASDPDAIDNARFDEEVRAYMRAHRGVSLSEARREVARKEMPRPEPRPSAPPPPREDFMQKGKRIARERGIPLSEAFEALATAEPELHEEYLNNAAAEQELKRIDRRLDSQAALRKYQPELAAKIDQAEAVAKQTAGLSRDERAATSAMEFNARRAKDVTLKLAITILLAAVCTQRPALAQAYPTEVYPATATIQGLNGTMDSGTGLSYIGSGTSPASSPPLQEQIDRRWHRQNQILGVCGQGRVVKVGDNAIGVFPLRFRIQGVDHSFTGSSSTAVSATADTYYVYLVSDGGGGGTVTVVADGTGWPADITTFIPLAEVTVAGGVISSILDVRNRLIYSTVTAGAAASTGVDGVYFILDQDNAGAEANSSFRFNRGATDDDAALQWNATDDLFEIYSDIVAGDRGILKLLSLESTVATGTAPLVVASTTVVTNLNADTVDGASVDSAGALDPGGVAYGSDASTLAVIAAGTSGQVLTSAGASAPTWTTVGSEGSAIQAYDADLDAVAGVATAGMLARTGAGTASARTITAGSSISVADGDGVSGNPTIAVAGATQYSVQVGSAAGALNSITVGADNTVLCGNTGANPSFRKVIDSDVNSAAAIQFSKMASGSQGQMLMCNAGGVPTLTTLAGAVTIDAIGYTVLDDQWADLCPNLPGVALGTEVSNVRRVTITLTNMNGQAYGSKSFLADVWLSDTDGPDLTATAATSLTVVTGTLMETVTANKHFRAAGQASSRTLVFDLEYTGGAKTWYLCVALNGLVRMVPVSFS